jgi:hypothetical protein
MLDRETNKLIREWSSPELSGNFAPGWVQFRKTLNDEYITDYTGDQT